MNKIPIQKFHIFLKLSLRRIYAYEICILVLNACAYTTLSVAEK